MNEQDEAEKFWEWNSMNWHAIHHNTPQDDMRQLEGWLARAALAQPVQKTDEEIMEVIRAHKFGINFPWGSNEWLNFAPTMVAFARALLAKQEGK